MVDLSKGKVREKVDESSVYRARAGSFSRKTTIPEYVCECLKLDTHEKETLEWGVWFPDDENEEPIAILGRKKKE